MDLDPGLPADVKRLLDAVAAVGAIELDLSRLDHVDAAGIGNRTAQVEELGGVSPGTGIVAGPRGKADGPLLEALRYHAPGLLGVVAGQGHVAEPEELETDGPVRHEIGGVDGDPAVVVAAESGDRIHRQAGDRFAEQAGKPAPVGEVVGRRQGGEGHSVEAHDLGGDPLPQPVGVLRVG